jgi:hypothetical protein
MKFRLFLSALLLILGLVPAAQSQTAVKNWVLSLEIGSGNIVGLTFGRVLTKSIDVGLGAGFDTAKELVGEENYSLLMLNGNIFGVYRLFDSQGIDLSGRLQIGYNVLSARLIHGESATESHLNTQAFDLTPALLGGYKNLYAILSGVFMLTKDFSFVPQIGIGYRFRF